MRRVHFSDPIENVKSIDNYMMALQKEKQRNIDKALQYSQASDMFSLDSYFGLMNKKQFNQSNQKALIIDPYYGDGNMGYFQKPSSIGFALLNRMSHAPIIRAIINTRKDQVAEFVHPQKDKYSKGFIIQKKHYHDKQESLTVAEEKEVESLINFLDNAGDVNNKWHVDSFESFTRKMIEDSLTYDQYCFEIIRYRNKDIAEFIAVDGSSIRIAETYDENKINDIKYKSHIIDGYLPSYVQIYMSSIYAEFYPWEMCVGIRNPQTNMRQMGYGRSELEDLIQTVTAMLNSDSYNANFFTNGSAPKGMMLLKNPGGINNDILNEFRSDWQAQMAGIQNMHKTPVFDADAIEWLDFQKTNKDMEFYKYQEYLIKLACAIYKISPEEVGFPLQGSGQRGLARSGGGNKNELDYSKEKGLAPLLRNYQRHINQYIIGPKSNEKYELKFVGVNAESEREEDDRIIKATGGAYMEINEARELKGLKTKPEYDTLSQLLGRGNPESDDFMDFNYGDEEDNDDVNKSDNPIWNNFEEWFSKEISN